MSFSDKFVYSPLVEYLLGLGFLGGAALVGVGITKVSVEHNRPVIAEVLAENYLGSKYLMKLRTVEGTGLNVEVKDSEGLTAVSIDSLVQPGMCVSFPRGNLTGLNYTHDETYFKEGVTIGSKLANRIKILGYGCNAGGIKSKK